MLTISCNINPALDPYLQICIWQTLLYKVSCIAFKVYIYLTNSSIPWLCQCSSILYTCRRKTVSSCTLLLKFTSSHLPFIVVCSFCYIPEHIAIYQPFSHFKKSSQGGFMRTSWLLASCHYQITPKPTLEQHSVLVWWIILTFCFHFKAKITSKNQSNPTEYILSLHISQIKLCK